MKYSKELHEHALIRIHDQGDVISFGTPFVESLLDEIARLTALVERLKEDGERLAVIVAEAIRVYKSESYVTGNEEDALDLHRQLMQELEG